MVDTYNCAVRKISSSGIITTFAGGNGYGYFGDGGPATIAEFADPTGIALDASGNLYIADTYNYVIRKVSPMGTIATVAGSGSPGYTGDGGLATAAQLSETNGIALDSSGNLYVADTYNSALRKVTTDGIISTLSGTSTGLNYPWGVALDAAGNVYISEYFYDQVKKCPNGDILSRTSLSLTTPSIGFSACIRTTSRRAVAARL